MKLTKARRKYIAEFSAKAADIFKIYGFTWGGVSKCGYVPSLEEIEQVTTELVKGFNPDVWDSTETGRIFLTTSEIPITGIRLRLDICGGEYE